MQGVVLWEGWLDRKGSALLQPWTRHFIVLSSDMIRHYLDEQRTQCKGQLALDESTRIMYVDVPSTGAQQSDFRFCVATKQGILQLSTPNKQERSQWMQKLFSLVGDRSQMANFVVGVASDADYSRALNWEHSLVAHSLAQSSGLSARELRREADSMSPAGSPLLGMRASISKEPADYGEGEEEDEQMAREWAHAQAAVEAPNPQFASFLPFDSWQEVFEPEQRLRRAKEKQPETEPTTFDRMKDYMLESIVGNISTYSTAKSCRLLLEGLCQLIAAAERQLVRTYFISIHRQMQAQTQRQAAMDTDAPPTAAVATEALAPEAAETAEAARTAEDGEDGEKEELPLRVQEDLICALGSLRALMLSYRFETAAAAASQGAQVEYARRLAVHQLQGALSRVMESLQTSIRQSHPKGATVEGAEGAEGAEGDSAERKAAVHKAAVQQLRAILKPLLSRKFLQLEAAPILQEFMKSSNSSSMGLEGAAAELSSVFGGVLSSFVKKKAAELESKVVAQLEIFVLVIESNKARHGDSGSKSTASTSGGDSSSGADRNSKRISGVPALPSSDDIMNDLAEQKAALEAKIKEMKGSGTPVWGRSDSSIVDLVLLEKADRLWGLLQATVHSAIHGGVYALLSMCGAGNQPAPAQKAKPFSFF